MGSGGREAGALQAHFLPPPSMGLVVGGAYLTDAQL